MNVAAGIRRAVKAFSNQTALRMENEDITYAGLEERANAVAAYLRSEGFREGDKLGVYLPNCPDYLILLYATWILGGVAVPLNYRFHRKSLRFVLKDAEIKWLVTTKGDLTRLKGLTEDLRLHLLLREKDLPHIYRQAAEEFPICPKRDDEDAMLMYTSGTTGMPKGVRQTHRNNSASVEMVIDAWELTNKDHLLLPIPMFHVGGLQCSTLPTLFTGGTITFLPKWDAKSWLAASRNEKVTWSGLVASGCS